MRINQRVTIIKLNKKPYSDVDLQFIKKRILTAASTICKYHQEPIAILIESFIKLILFLQIKRSIQIVCRHLTKSSIHRLLLVSPTKLLDYRQMGNGHLWSLVLK